MNRKPENKRRKISKVTRACNSCRKRKIKCSGFSPCTNCQSYHCECEFENPVLGEDSRSIYRSNVETLNSFSSLSQNVKELVLDLALNEDGQSAVAIIKQQLKILGNTLQPQVDTTVAGNIDGDKHCLESQLVSGYNKIHFHKFLICDPAKLVDPTRTDQYFGVYSPMVLFSLPGVIWIFKRLFLLSGSPVPTKPQRESLLIVLKVLDSGATDFKNSLKYWCNPLALYPSDISAYVSTFGKHDLDTWTRENKCSSVLQTLLCLYSGSTEDKPYPMSETEGLLLMFVSLLKRYNKEFRRLYTESLSDGGLFSRLFDLQESLFDLTTKAFLTIKLQPFVLIEVLEAMIMYIEESNLLMRTYPINYMVSKITRLGVERNHHRWEHYFGLSESEADRRRRFIWKCYILDKWPAIYFGQVTHFRRDCITALFPACVIRLGIYQMSDETLLDPREKYDIEGLVWYCEIKLAMLIEDIYSKVLYNAEYSGIQVLNPQRKNKDQLYYKVLEEIMDYIKQFLELKSRIRQIADTRSSSNEEERALAIKTWQKFHLTVASTLEACGALVNRLRRGFGFDTADPRIAEIENFKLKASTEVVESVIQFKESYFTWRSLLEILMCCLFIFVKILTWPAEFDHVVLLLKFSQQLQTVNKNISDSALHNPTYLATFQSMNVIIPAFTRIALLAFQGHFKYSDQELANKACESDPCLLQVFQEVVDVNSQTYSSLWKLNVTDYHKIISHSVDKELLEAAPTLKKEQAAANDLTQELNEMSSKFLEFSDEIFGDFEITDDKSFFDYFNKLLD